MTDIPRWFAGLSAVLLVGTAVACGGAVPPPTPEGPAILATIRAIVGDVPTPPPPTPEGPAILATVRAIPTPPRPTPEGPSIMATVQAIPAPPRPTPEGPSIMATVASLLATPTATPLPTNTPGPTPTPRSRETSTFSLGLSVVRTIPVRLALGERLEGFYSTPKADITLVIQNPSGSVVRDYGQQATSNFQVTASDAGLYSLIFKARARAGDSLDTTFSVSYSYEVYGR